MFLLSLRRRGTASGGAFRQARLWPLVVAALLLVLPAGAARAHATLSSADPPEGAVVETAPEAVTLWFSEEVRPLIARLTDPEGRTRVLPEPEVEGRKVLWPLPELTQQGSYLLSWRSTARDGHVMAGGQLFSLGHPGGRPPEEARAPATVLLAVWLLRALVLAALVFGAGGAVLVALLRLPAPPLIRQISRAGLAALPLLVLTEPLYRSAEGFTALFTPLWAAGLSDLPGLLPRIAAALALLGAVLLPRVRQRGAAVTGAVTVLLLLLAASALTGHVATAPPAWLMRPALVLHLLGAVLWLGALAPLALTLQRGQGGFLQQFSRLAPLAVALLLASGVALAVVQTGGWERLRADRAWLQVLAVKLLLVALLLGLALRNRRLTPAALSGRVRPLVALIRLEVLTGILLMAVVGLWAFTVPPRVQAGDQPQEIVLSEGDLRAVLRAGDRRSGPLRLELTGVTRGGLPLLPEAAEVRLSKPAFGLGPFRAPLLPLAEGGSAEGRFLLPMDGFWVVELTLTLSAFESVTLKEILTLTDTPDGG